MNAWSDILLILLTLSAFAILNSGRLGASIRLIAFQGVLAGLLPVIMPGQWGIPHVIGTGIVMIAIKGLVFPKLLFRSLQASNTRREQQPLLGYMFSLVFGVAMLLFAFWLDTRLQLPAPLASGLILPTAVFLILTGLYVIITRRIALNQVIGFLMLENGIYVFGLAVVRDVPILIELSVLLDVFVAVFVMGIAICQINREFDHMDSDRLTSLKG